MTEAAETHMTTLAHPAPVPTPPVRLRLHRMPLVWVAVGVPAQFLFWMFFMMTPV